jgi:hypothetical protein
VPYFYFDKESQQFWSSPDSKIDDFLEIQYGIVTFSDSFFQISPLNSVIFSIQNEYDSLILNSKTVQPPCAFCKQNIKTFFSSKICTPCSFHLIEPYDKYNLPFNKNNLEISLINKGYIRTSKKLFLKSIYQSRFST